MLTKARSVPRARKARLLPAPAGAQAHRGQPGTQSIRGKTRPLSSACIAGCGIVLILEQDWVGLRKSKGGQAPVCMLCCYSSPSRSGGRKDLEPWSTIYDPAFYSGSSKPSIMPPSMPSSTRVDRLNPLTSMLKPSALESMLPSTGCVRRTSVEPAFTFGPAAGCVGGPRCSAIRRKASARGDD